jgi:hypothetical protein
MKEGKNGRMIHREPTHILILANRAREAERLEQIERLARIKYDIPESPKPRFIWNFWTILGIVEMVLFIVAAELAIFKCLFGWKFW